MGAHTGGSLDHPLQTHPLHATSSAVDVSRPAPGLSPARRPRSSTQVRPPPPLSLKPPPTSTNVLWHRTAQQQESPEGVGAAPPRERAAARTPYECAAEPPAARRGSSRPAAPLPQPANFNGIPRGLPTLNNGPPGNTEDNDDDDDCDTSSERGPALDPLTAALRRRERDAHPHGHRHDPYARPDLPGAGSNVATSTGSGQRHICAAFATPLSDIFPHAVDDAGANALGTARTTTSGMADASARRTVAAVYDVRIGSRQREGHAAGTRAVLLDRAVVSVLEAPDRRDHTAGFYYVQTIKAPSFTSPSSATTTETSEPTTITPSPKTASTPTECIASLQDKTTARQPTTALQIVASRPDATCLQSATPLDSLTVRRSIADFVWLEENLRLGYDSVIVPILPPMALAGRLIYGYTYDYERRRGIEKFLRRVVAHPVLASSEQAAAFLGLMGEDVWKSVRRDLSHHHRSIIAAAIFGNRSAGDRSPDPLHWISRWSSYKMWQAGRRINRSIGFFLERDNPADLTRSTNADTPEARLGRLKAYIDELGTSLAIVRRAAARASASRAEHVRSDDALGHALSNLGSKERGHFGRLLQGSAIAQRPLVEEIRSSSHLTSPEPPIPATSTMQDGTGTLALQLSRPSADLTEHQHEKAAPAGKSPPRSVAELDCRAGRGLVQDNLNPKSNSSGDQALEEILREYEQRANGAKRIMGARLAEQEAYEHALEVYTRLRDKVEARTGSMWQTDPNDSSVVSGGGSSVMEELYESVSVAEAALGDARKQYKEVAVATTVELRRLRRELHADVAVALSAVAKENARHHASRAAAWSTLDEHCNAYIVDGKQRSLAKSDLAPMSRMTIPRLLYRSATNESDPAVDNRPLPSQ
jgi:PX domain